MKLKLVRFLIGLCGSLSILIFTNGLWNILPTISGFPLIGIVLISLAMCPTAWGLGWFDGE